jgi:hypothetical protein
MGDYSQQINKLLDDQKYLMSGVNTVYPLFSLDQLINNEQSIEFDKIKKFKIDLNNLNLKKKFNLAKLYNEHNEVLSLNEKMILKNKDLYNSDFNENVKKINDLNHIISTKNKTIQINEYEQTKKDRIILIMKKIILFLVLMILPILSIAINIISFANGMLFILLCAIITVIVVFFQMKNNKDDDLVNILNKTKATSKEFAVPIIKNILPETMIKKCISKKNPKETIQYSYDTGNEVWLDNSEDVWKTGDIPSIGATKDGYLALGEKAEPMPYYGGDKETPQYTCEWQDDPSKMTNMNRRGASPGTRFTTTIPCEYYPGYKTISSKS